VSVQNVEIVPRNNNPAEWSFVSEHEMSTSGVLRIFKSKPKRLSDNRILIEKLDFYKKIVWETHVFTQKEYDLIIGSLSK
jgi:hypothetical protein